jgi:hypothetical protein
MFVLELVSIWIEVEADLTSGIVVMKFSAQVQDPNSIILGFKTVAFGRRLVSETGNM